MLTTPEGQDIIASYIPTEFDGVLQEGVTQEEQELITARNFALYHYMSEWYALEAPFLFDCKYHAYPTFHDDCDICFNGRFVGNQQSDHSLLGFKMFDGLRFNIIDCDESNVDYQPLPENSIPRIPPNGNFEFDLDPTNNGSPYSPGGGRGAANFHSFEMFVNEPDKIIPTYISSTPPSGNKSIKVNNHHVRYHINKLTRTFELRAEDDYFYYSNALVLEDPNHRPRVQPFGKVVLRKGSTIIYESCVIADRNNTSLNVVDLPNRRDPIVYRDWTCHEVDLRSYREEGIIKNGDQLTAEFIAADCGAGAHFGYMYVADICEECRILDISFDVNGVRTCSNTEICGSYTVDESYEVEELNFLLVNQQGQEFPIGSIVYKTFEETVGSEGEKNVEFCFNLHAGILSNFPNGSYDIYAELHLSNGTIKRSLSLIQNTQSDQANDVVIDDGCRTFTDPHNLSAEELKNSVLVFPNPTSGELSISLGQTENYNITSVDIIDPYGNFVRKVLPSGKNQITTNLSDLPKGYYQLKVYFDVESLSITKGLFLH